MTIEAIVAKIKTLEQRERKTNSRLAITDDRGPLRTEVQKVRADLNEYYTRLVSEIRALRLRRLAEIERISISGMDASLLTEVSRLRKELQPAYVKIEMKRLLS